MRVRVLPDGLGSGAALDASYVKELRDAGCSFAYYHAVLSWRIDRMNRRTHRRVLVVDGRVGFTGGVGFSVEWQGDADAPEHWREVHARLEGPIVGRLQAAFQEHWFKEVGETLSGKGQFPDLEQAGDLRARPSPATRPARAPVRARGRLRHSICAPSLPASGSAGSTAYGQRQGWAFSGYKPTHAPLQDHGRDSIFCLGSSNFDRIRPNQ